MKTVQMKILYLDLYFLRFFYPVTLLTSQPSKYLFVCYLTGLPSKLKALNPFQHLWVPFQLFDLTKILENMKEMPVE